MVHLEPFDGRLEPDGDYEGLAFDHLDLAGQDAEHARFMDCALTGCNLDGANLDHVQLLDTTLTEVHAGAFDLPDATWRDVTLTDCTPNETITVSGGNTLVYTKDSPSAGFYTVKVTDSDSDAFTYDSSTGKIS